MIDGIKDKHRLNLQELLSQAEKVEKVVLFGSRAMKTFTVQSDIDIALFGDDLTLSDQAELQDKIERLDIPQRVDLLRYNTITNQNLKEHIQQYGIVWSEK